MAGSLAVLLATAVAAVSHGAVPRRAGAPSLVARPLHRTVVLRAAPGGKPLVRLGRRGPLGESPVFGVVGVRGRWVEVTSEALSNGHFGWVEFGRDVALRSTAWRLRVSLARRELFVLHNGRVARTITVAIGAAASPTPSGRFAIAEKLFGSFGPPYGCCILALTAQQPRLPAGWDRSKTYYVAIHGGSGQGSAVSAGCLHASDADLRYLMRTIPVGTAVQITR
ncbi:MAG: L,D-transpeptidase [Actinobacteria bacterium]|nr:MAG: L,D-transpeptidase [Actinomycetota bacterium]